MAEVHPHGPCPAWTARRCHNQPQHPGTGNPFSCCDCPTFPILTIPSICTMHHSPDLGGSAHAQGWSAELPGASGSRTTPAVPRAVERGMPRQAERSRFPSGYQHDPWESWQDRALAGIRCWHTLFWCEAGQAPRHHAVHRAGKYLITKENEAKWLRSLARCIGTMNARRLRAARQGGGVQITSNRTTSSHEHVPGTALCGTVATGNGPEDRCSPDKCPGQITALTWLCLEDYWADWLPIGPP